MLIKRSLLAFAVCGLISACAGPEGPAGAQGPAGATGTPGATGAQGVPGATGSTGPAGQNGQNGQPGATGPAGDAGPAGRDLRYVGPGLAVTVLDAGIDSAGVTTVELKLADSAGRGLDRNGLYTEGAVSVSFVLGYLDERADGLPLQYVSYTKRTVAFDGGSTVQNATDTNGTWTELDPLAGTWRYRFGTVATVGANANKTHSIGLYATRTFQGDRYVDNDVVHFRPDGQAVTAKRDIVTTQACNGCHTRLEAHGGARREVGLCVMCHTDTNAIDPESGNTFDFKVMVHKIHRGATLPSVDAGTPYYFVGFNNAVSDFSHVAYPGKLADCDVCHAGTQGDRWNTNINKVNCSGCHDRTWFETTPMPAGYTMHAVGPRNDTTCALCHGLTGPYPVDQKHVLASRDLKALRVTGRIVSAPPTPPGTRPTFTFALDVNGAPREVLTQRLSRLRFVVGGPNTDIARYWSETAENAADCAAVTDGGACLTRLDAGVYSYRAATALLPTDTGSFTVGIEACATSDAGVRYCATNPVAPFAVTDPTPVARRKDVTLTQCNACHDGLAAHGGTRNNTEHCVICHNANTVLRAVVPADGGVVTAGAANFKDLIHEVHAAAEYPSPLNNCAKCHTATGASLPVPDGVLPSRSENQSCGPSGAPTDGGTTCVASGVLVTPVFTAPTSAACTSCHSSLSAQVHASLNTTSTGQEACAVCHAAGRSAGIDTAHRLVP